MSLWTNIRDKVTMLLTGYGISKVLDKNTSWVDTREQIKATAVEAVVKEETDNKK